MLPTTPSGHAGAPSPPAPIAPAVAPRILSASRAHARASANSRRRPSLAPAISASSTGSSCGRIAEAAAGGAPSIVPRSTPTAPGGRIAASVSATRRALGDERQREAVVALLAHRLDHGGLQTALLSEARIELPPACESALLAPGLVAVRVRDRAPSDDVVGDDQRSRA